MMNEDLRVAATLALAATLATGILTAHRSSLPYSSSWA